MKAMTKRGMIILLGMTLALSSALADETAAITITVKDGTFIPAEITGPANAKFKLVLRNEGKEAEEFESVELNREKVVAPGKSATIFLGPLKPGTYGFFGEFHPTTAKGTLVIK